MNDRNGRSDFEWSEFVSLVQPPPELDDAGNPLPVRRIEPKDIYCAWARSRSQSADSPRNLNTFTPGHGMLSPQMSVVSLTGVAEKSFRCGLHTTLPSNDGGDGDHFTTTFALLPAIRLENLLPMGLHFQLLNASKFPLQVVPAEAKPIVVTQRDVLLEGHLGAADQQDVMFMDWPSAPCVISLRVLVDSNRYRPYGWTDVRVPL